MILKLIYAFIIATLISACGGGGGTVPTDPNQLFNLEKFKYNSVGPVYSSSVTGNDSDGVSYTGSINLVTRAQEMYSGVLSHPTDSILNLTGGGKSVTTTATTYVDSSTHNVLATVTQATGLVCTFTSPDHMPFSVKIGDSGNLSSGTCSDDTIIIASKWRVEDGGNGTIKLIQSGVRRDQLNNIDALVDTTFTIDGGQYSWF